MSEHQLSEGLVFGLGNPLLDVSAAVDEQFLQKWALEANNAILATDKHDGLVDDLVKNFETKFIAGGAVQNSMRMIQWILRKPQVCTFMGCIGNDYFGRCMEMKAAEDGVNSVYMKDEKEKTGHCAVLITNNGKNRSLCAFLGAANSFKKDHLEKHWQVAEKAKYFYVSGYAITVSLPAVLAVANYASKFEDRYFCFNLSAPYISEFFSQQLLEVIPFVDILFGNETEAEAFAVLKGLPDKKNVAEVAKFIANMDKSNTAKRRIVVMTQGSEPVIVAKQNESEVQSFNVKLLEDKQIVDTNGAGDAFAAGFLSQFVLRKSIEECVKVGIYAAQQIIQQDGCSIPQHLPQFDK